MRELRGHTSPYDTKRTSAFHGPYKQPRENRFAAVLFTIVIAVGLAAMAFFGLSADDPLDESVIRCFPTLPEETK